jgi:hypothetical protein
MTAYFFQIDLPEITEELECMIPQQRAYVNKLFSDGVLLSYSVSMQRDCLWCVINAGDEQQAMDFVVKFPLYKFFSDVICSALLFHNTQSVTLPDISLN